METKKLDIFLQTIKIGSMKKAAEDLNYTQSGLIYTINTLEQELGLKLLLRTPKGIVLTDTGETLRPLIENVVESENILLDKINELSKQKKYMLRIGSYPIFARYYLPEIIQSFLKENPEYEIDLHVGTERDLKEWIKQDAIDIAIGEQTLSSDGDWIHLMDDEVHVAVPTSYELGDCDSLSMDTIKDYPILLSKQNPVSDLVEKLIDEENAPKIKIDSPDGSVLLSMVEKQTGIAFLSSLYLNVYPEKVQMYKLDPPVIRKLGVVTKVKKSSSPFKKFINCLCESVK